MNPTDHTVLLENKRIFILEDNAMNRIVYQLTLRRHSAWLEFDRWGRETITRIRQFKDIDLVILDLMLPNRISGYEVFEQIRQEPELENVPIIAVSASEPAVAIPKTQSLGFSGFIAKPIDEDLFAQQLADVIAGEEIWYAGSKT